jgi:hypothetical protein
LAFLVKGSGKNIMHKYFAGTFREKHAEFREILNTIRKSFRFCETSKNCFGPNSAVDMYLSQA